MKNPFKNPWGRLKSMEGLSDKAIFLAIGLAVGAVAGAMTVEKIDWGKVKANARGKASTWASTALEKSNGFLEGAERGSAADLARRGLTRLAEMRRTDAPSVSDNGSGDYAAAEVAPELGERRDERELAMAAPTAYTPGLEPGPAFDYFAPPAQSRYLPPVRHLYPRV